VYERHYEMSVYISDSQTFNILTVTWNVHPDTVLVKCFLVSVKALEAAFDITRAGSIH
jgi:hypothetical protein